MSDASTLAYGCLAPVLACRQTLQCDFSPAAMAITALAQTFKAFGGVPRRGIFDNMKIAVDKVSIGKARAVNARFQAMCSHYLFEPEFYNPSSGRRKGIVEKNVQACRTDDAKCGERPASAGGRTSAA